MSDKGMVENTIILKKTVKELQKMLHQYKNENTRLREDVRRLRTLRKADEQFIGVLKNDIEKLETEAYDSEQFALSAASEVSRLYSEVERLEGLQS